VEQLSTCHHLVVVLGDFNSRRRLPRDEAPFVASASTGLSCAKPWRAADERLRDDELVGGLLGRSLEGFEEGAVTFEPTFGYLPGTDEVDRKRRPAWTDRVVFRASRGARASLEEYGAFQELRHTSDHRPVAATLRLTY